MDNLGNTIANIKSVNNYRFLIGVTIMRSFIMFALYIIILITLSVFIKEIVNGGMSAEVIKKAMPTTQNLR